jgi:sulfatase maturation enzyme AslB (radical SAM superfamily)
MQNHQPQAQKVYFEVTNHCNFRCDFCPMAESKRKRQHMDYALFTKGIHDVVTGNIADTVGFHILGEPLLYSRIFEAVSYAKSKGLRTEINTNGSLLTEKRVHALVQAGLDTLCISVQVLNANEHTSRGSNLPFDVYYRRVMDAVQLIRASGSSMNVVLCAMDTSTKQYFDIDKLMRVNGKRSDFAKDLAGFIFNIYSRSGTSVSRVQVEAALHRLNLNTPQFVQLDEHIKVYAQPLADWGNAFTARKVYPARFGACGYALSNVGILSTGEVTICCADYDGHTSLGNLRSHSLAELLASEKAEAIREGFRQNKIIHPYCQRCIGSPNPLKAWFKGLASIYLFKWLDFEPARVKQVPLFQA